MTEPVVLFPDVTVVVVAYNSADVLPGCIASLAPGQPLVLVDNASGDDSAAVVKRLAPWAEVIVRPVNEGFGSGANIGFARVKTEFGLLLNPDTQFDATAMIGALVAAARRYPDAGLLAPMLTEAGKGGLFWGRQIFRSPPLAKPPHDVSPEGDTCSQYVGGSVMFFPMQAFRAGIPLLRG
jgi:GT2 family glycosyltransferase